MNDEILELYPIRECKFEVKDGIVTVLYDKFEKTFLDRIIKSKKKRIAKIKLDKIGSFVWNICDGKRTTADIINECEKEFGENEEKIPDRVKLFLNQLAGKKFIRFYTLK